ncbi:MAG: hypothetical protein EVA43_04180 [Flavobacteriales bacterium]|nr:MAG: hypothetical protein EVA43_04180 [Flavobacteriales bacterium]
MQLSEDLKGLVESSIADGKISSKERKVILKRALSEGHDQDEFEIYLDSLVQTAKSENKTVRKNSLLSFIKWIGQKKRRVIIAFFILSGILQLVVSISNAAYQDDIASERGCDSVDDCITKYKFEEARAYAEYGFVNKNLRTIIKSEVTYYTSQKELDIAFRSIMEYTFQSGFEPQGRNYINESYNSEAQWYNSLVENVLVDFETDETNLKKLIYSIKPIAKIGDSYKKDEDCINCNEYKFEEDNSKKTELMKRYNLKL